MKIRLLIGVLILSIIGTILLAKGPAVNQQLPFFVFPFKYFNLETQEFIPGLGLEDFQIEVPEGEELDQISLSGDKLKRERIRLAEYGVGTDYVTVTTKDGFYLFQGSGVTYFNSTGSIQNWNLSLSEQKNYLGLEGPAYPTAHGSATVVLSRAGFEKNNEISETQLARFFPEEGKRELLLTLQEEDELGVLDLINLPDGFIANRMSQEWVEGDHAQYYDLDGKPAPHPLAIGINLLHRHKIDLSSPDGLPSYGAFYPSQTSAAWGLFPWDSMPGHLDKRLFILSVTDTVQAVPVTCERYRLEPQESLTFILVNPKLNLFLLGARLHRNDDSVMMYLGRVRKDSTGKVYRAETFRVKYFPEVESPIFSRNGQVLLFAMRDGVQTNLVLARLADIVADVNRRYPDAKFDLDELK